MELAPRPPGAAATTGRSASDRASFRAAPLLRGLWAALTSDKKLVISSQAFSEEHLRAVTAMIEAGELRPVIDRRCPLEQAAKAHRYVDSEQKLGKIVIVVAQARLAD